MQSDIDAQLTNFFEDAPPREFAVSMRGYERHQVDEYVRQADAELRTHREQTQTMRRDLADAHRQIQEQERPTYSGLGARIAQLGGVDLGFGLHLVGLGPGRRDQLGPRPPRSRPRPRSTPPSCAP